jgi:hypothetical protein
VAVEDVGERVGITVQAARPQRSLVPVVERHTL